MKKSRKLGVPLPLDKKLLNKISLRIPWRSDKTEAQNIASALRNIKGRNCRLSDRQVKIILDEIEKIEYSGVFPLEGWDETAIERILAKKPYLLEKGLKLLHNQMSTPHGKIDLVFIHKKEDKILVVEVKRGKAPDKVLTQLLSYVNFVQKAHSNKKVEGIIVCANCSQCLINAAKAQKIKIYLYRGKITLEKAE